jgi:choline monooxygenase
MAPEYDSRFVDVGALMVNTARPLPAESFTREETYRETRRPVSAATTLLPDAYTSESFFALEQERVLATSWVAVACTSELARPGDFVAVEVAGQPLLVVRGGDGTLRSFYNVCRHRGTRLCDAGAGHVDRFFRCPYHSWAYDLDGRCLGTPLFEGSEIPESERAIFDMGDVRAFDKADYGLYPVRVERFGCLVFVNLDPDAAPLAAQLGDLPERLAGYRLEEWRLVREKAYEIRANYKLIGENFMEYYHLPWVHPGLVKVSPMKSHYRWQGPGMYTGMTTTPIAQNADSGGWKGLPPIGGLEGDDAVSARFAWLFPNTALNVLPNHLFVMLTRPVAPGHTVERTCLLVHPESLSSTGADDEIDQLARFWDEVNREDIAIVERVQEGLGARAYTGGRMCYRFEEPLHRFQNMVIDRMVGIRRVPPGDSAERMPMFAAQTPA